MWRSLLIFSLLLVIVYCDGGYRPNGHGSVNLVVRKKKHHHHDHFYHKLLRIFSYVTFFAIKLKVIFVIGAAITIFMVAGKVFALLKYTDILKHKLHHEPEKIYLHDHDHHHGGFDFPPPGGFVDSPYSGGYGGFDHPGGDYGPSRIGGRSAPQEEFSLTETFGEITRLIRSLNLTDFTFNSMGIKSVDCRKKFVCQADLNSKQSDILRNGFEVFGDENYEKYRTNSTVNSNEDCEQLYKDCPEDYS